MKFIGKMLCNIFLWLCENILLAFTIGPSLIMIFIVKRTQSNLVTWMLKSLTLHTIFIVYVLDVLNEAVNKNTDINKNWHDFKQKTSVISNLSLDEIKENLSDLRFYSM